MGWRGNKKKKGESHSPRARARTAAFEFLRPLRVS